MLREIETEETIGFLSHFIIGVVSIDGGGRPLPPGYAYDRYVTLMVGTL